MKKETEELDVSEDRPYLQIATKEHKRYFGEYTLKSGEVAAIKSISILDAEALNEKNLVKESGFYYELIEKPIIKDGKVVNWIALGKNGSGEITTDERNGEKFIKMYECPEQVEQDAEELAESEDVKNKEINRVNNLDEKISDMEIKADSLKADNENLKAEIEKLKKKAK